jgi:hypothetical protein
MIVRFTHQQHKSESFRVADGIADAFTRQSSIVETAMNVTTKVFELT